MFTIHESQLKIFPTEFPFARNKVEKKDISRIERAVLLISNTPCDAFRITLDSKIDGPALKLCFFISHYLDKYFLLIPIQIQSFVICRNLNS